MPQSIVLPVRYCRLTADDGIPWREESFELRELSWELRPEQTALVLVDVWDIHPIESHEERSALITRDRVAPVAAACREAGVTVVHAPSPGQARKYPEWLQYAGDRELFGTGVPPEDDWPPPEFRGRKGEFAAFAKPAEPRRERWLKEELPKRRVLPCAEPREGDFVVATGEQLHRLLKHRGVLHLLYAGFAANMCVLMRDYGIQAMARRGYNIILLRDCTTAIESRESFPGMGNTAAAVSIVEMVHGVTTTSGQFLAACGVCTSH